MHAASLFDKFEKMIRANPDLYMKDYYKVKKKVENSSAKYKGKPVKFLYQPMFYTNNDIKRFEYLTSTLTDILNRVIEEYLNNPLFRKKFGFSPEMEELILIDPGYKVKFPMARFDIFYPYNNDYEFCELNADGSSSMNESRVLHNLIKDSRALDKVVDRNKVYDYELFDSWIDTLLKCYKEFNAGNFREQPNIAIVDFEGEGVISEFKVFRERFIQRGYDTVICDPRQLIYKNGKLYYKMKRIDLVYRRATTVRLVDNLHDIQDFINAYKNRAVCVVGGLVSQIIHNKKIFSILHEIKTKSFLTDEQKQFIRKHIPYTRVLDPSDTQLFKYILEDRNNLIIKPADSLGAHGVYIGRECSCEEWERVIAEAHDKSYIVQKLCDIPYRSMPTINEGKLTFQKYNYITGLFMYNQKFNGIYTRAGRKSVIATISECFTLPNFII